MRTGRVAAVAASILWLVIGGVAALVAVTSAAVGLPAFVLFAPLAVASVFAAIAVVRVPGSSWVGIGSVLLGTLLGAVAIWSLVTRTGDDGSSAGNLAIAVASLSATTFSLLAWGLGRTPSGGALARTEAKQAA